MTKFSQRLPMPWTDSSHSPSAPRRISVMGCFAIYPPQRREVAQTGTPFIARISSPPFITKVGHGRPATFLPSTHLYFDSANKNQLIKERLLLFWRRTTTSSFFCGELQLGTCHLAKASRPCHCGRRLQNAPACLRHRAAAGCDSRRVIKEDLQIKILVAV